MKRAAIAAAAATLLLSACSPTRTLYYWGGTQNGTTAYENLAYQDYKTKTPAAVCKLICVYQDIVTNPVGTRKMPPPGICAEYGYLLLQPGIAETFTKNASFSQKRLFGKANDYEMMFAELGAEMLRKEMEYYPESEAFIAPLLKRLVRK